MVNNKKITGIVVVLLCYGAVYGQYIPAKPVPAVAETDTYGKIVNSHTESYKGFITIHRNGDKLYLEISKTIVGRDLLVGEWLSRISANRSISAGEMYSNPWLIHFEKDGEQLFLYKKDKTGLISDG